LRQTTGFYQAVVPRINSIAKEHRSIIKSLNNPQLDYDGERDLLNRICKLSARAEEMAAATHARLSASKAYFAIVEDRLESLRMGPVAGLQPYYTSIMNRLRPAVRSLDSALMRMDKQVRVRGGCV